MKTKPAPEDLNLSQLLRCRILQSLHRIRGKGKSTAVIEINNNSPASFAVMCFDGPRFTELSLASSFESGFKLGVG